MMSQSSLNHTEWCFDLFCWLYFIYYFIIIIEKVVRFGSVRFGSVRFGSQQRHGIIDEPTEQLPVLLLELCEARRG
jgi:choline-glycine betaine transporter